MIKSLLLFLLIIFLGEGCVPVKNTSDKRRELIEKTINAIMKYDTIELYHLVDTAHCFNLIGKNAFLHKIDYVYNRFKLCDTAIIDTAVKIEVTNIHTKEYTIPFCRNEEGGVIYDSFDLLLTFADYYDNQNILFLDVVIHRRKNIPTPNIPAPILRTN